MAKQLQAAISESTRIVEMIGRGLGARDGCVIEAISQDVHDTILAALAVPNGGVSLDVEHKTVQRLAVPQSKQDAETARADAVEQAEKDRETLRGLLPKVLDVDQSLDDPEMRALLAALIRRAMV